MKESKKEIDRLRKALSLGFIFVDRPTPGNEAAFREAIANVLLDDSGVGAEITPEMIEAGALALSEYTSAFEGLEDGAERVYRSMEAARKRPRHCRGQVDTPRGEEGRMTEMIGAGMNEMVERVAREILKANESKVTGHRLSPDDVMTAGPKEFIGQPLWRQFEDMARAAIAAMLEPTAAMRAAGHDANDRH